MSAQFYRGLIQGENDVKIRNIALLLSCTAFSMPAWAQDEVISTAATTAEKDDTIIVTGSSIKRKATDSASPLQIITTQDLAREGISNPEQLVALLSSNGNGADNLASNADVVAPGPQRGINGASSANLRNQGSGATLVLLNGRRVASHGLGGGAVDINQIPIAAVERIEVLKDGASAIYGTDAIGGVINFILKKNYEGFGVSTFVDKTQHDGGDIYKASVTAGIGNLDNDGFNLMVAGSYSENKALRGNQRDFVDTFQSNRGLSVDTRGTPYATIFPFAGTIIPSAATAPFVIGSSTIRIDGVNVLDLPGGAGCNSIADQEAYDELLWSSAGRVYDCGWDTGRAAVLQQPLQSLNFVGRGIVRLQEHEISLEYTRSDADSAKRFSNVQISPSTSQPLRFPRTADNAAVYDSVFNQLVAAFPTLAPNRGLPISYRWRCLECGPREYETNTVASRIFLGAEGPLAGSWSYRAGLSRASSQSESRLGSGYFYRGTTATGAVDALAPSGLINALNTGAINIFLRPGETQSAAGLAAINAASARGVVLYGGKFSVTQADLSTSGSLFNLPGGMAMAAVGVDYRKEEYRFNGDVRAAALRPAILSAPFDDSFSLLPVSRTIKAGYAELLLPLFNGFELTGAIRRDEYSGFGSTTNPKVSFKYRPVDAIMLRGSYNTGFRVPSFNQIFNGQQINPLPGADLADPKTCPGGIPAPLLAGCAAVNPDVITGGKLDLGPETSKQFGLGVVFQPVRNFSVTVDWWSIDRANTIATLSIRQLVDNYSLFSDRFIYDGTGKLIQVDRTNINAGASKTQGIDISVRGSQSIGSGVVSLGLDGTYLIEKKSQLVPNVPFGASEIGNSVLGGDLALRWKHNAFIAYQSGPIDFAISQIFRKGYKDRVLPGVANGTVTPPDLQTHVNDYVTYNFSLGYKFRENMKLTAGVKNLLDTDPPFAVTYDSDLGAGSSWEPRVADPRGRAFTLLAEFKF
jgi:iron complex outermembrane recepter protein